MTGRFGRLSDAPASVVIVGARVVDPVIGTEAVRDVAIRDGRIVEAEGAGGERIEGRGLVVAPGFCDLHAHLREPGTEAAETIESGARAAARGGFTTICAMPNTDPPLDEPSLLADLADRARGVACGVRFIAAATRGRAGAEPVDVAGLTGAGAVAVSDDGAAVPDVDTAQRLLTSLAGHRIPLVEHAEDAAIAAGSVMRAGAVASRLGLVGWRPEAELRVVERDLSLVEKTGAALHLTHLSTPAALDAVRRAKNRGLPVTCDVTPHHLALTDAWVAGSRRFAWDEPDPHPMDPRFAYDGATRVNPPLASRHEALGLLAGVADGTVDAIATDHAPHPLHRKLVPYADAAPGMVGLETALSLGLAAVAAGRLALPALVAALSSRPAAIIGEERGLDVGTRANLVAFDPVATWRVERGALASGSTNTPLLGMEVPGVVRLTVADGRITYRA